MGRSRLYATNSILEKWELKPLVLSDTCDFSPSINILRNPAKLERWVSHLVLPLYCHTYQPPENVSGSFHDLYKEFPPGHLCWPMTAFRHHPQAIQLASGIVRSICCCCSVTQSCLALCNPVGSAHQASLFFSISCSLLKLMSIELVMPSNHLIFCCPLHLLPSIFPTLGFFPMSLLLA